MSEDVKGLDDRQMTSTGFDDGDGGNTVVNGGVKGLCERLQRWPACPDGRDMLDAGNVATLMMQAHDTIERQAAEIERLKNDIKSMLLVHANDKAERELHERAYESCANDLDYCRAERDILRTTGRCSEDHETHRAGVGRRR
jgi:hypothetical protein